MKTTHLLSLMSAAMLAAGSISSYSAEKSAASAPPTVAKNDAKRIVDAAVTTISRCAEGDPRIDRAMKSLDDVAEPAVINALVPHLKAAKDTQRRSAVYILWRGDFSDISPAAPGLIQLLEHKEDLTRGMAALAVGQNKVAAGFDSVATMLRSDDSPYARRCAAYGLGLMEDRRAEPLLKAALNDSEVHVRNNAKAALEMLKNAE